MIMVKTKHKKSKPQKQSHIKKHGKDADISEFRAQLDALGLKIIQVTADGNCFFRALADQLEGNEEEHEKYRSMVVQYILKNREMYEPFIEDDVPFDEYCQLMEKDGTWAGHMELQAASLVTHTNICIHRSMSPRWYIRNFGDREARMIHLSYHDGEHYNSVRLKEDTCIGPARSIIIKADADLSATSHQAKVAVTKSKGEAGKNFIHAESIKLVIVGSGCENAKKVEQVLLQVGGDVDAAIEFLIAEQGTEEYLVESDKHPCSEDNSHGNGRRYLTSNWRYDVRLPVIAPIGVIGVFADWGSVPLTSDSEKGNCEPSKEEVLDNTCKLDASFHMERTSDSNSSRQDEKKIPRNKACPCGSKKKYKSCCGSVAGRSSSKFAINQTVDYGKGRKERKQGKKGEAATVANHHGSEGGPPDMGALCI